jgi:hypothetical protein
MTKVRVGTKNPSVQTESPGNPLTIKDEGISQGNPQTIDFTGAGVTATRNGDTVTVDIPGFEAGTYSTTLTFDTDQDIYKDATGLSPSFTLASSGNVNGVGIIVRLNKPTAVTFPANFEADANSATLDATKMNVYTLIYFANWNGSGTARVIYSNHLFTSV